ncbi:TPA: hypothetical protein DDZ86_01570 [Candidatus Dependentiae bacterium]|nr:MAG: hypothetical protein UW09_C0001G0322 [candidate division TM6 bacterium GW2011_GWF2_43_87]HBL98313.1 hypothetical protein [Candidatus Dependentiae bacterium]
MTRFNLKLVALPVLVLTVVAGLQATPKEFIEEAAQAPGRIIESMVGIPVSTTKATKNKGHRTERRAPKFIEETVRTPFKVIKKIAHIPGKIAKSIKNKTHGSKTKACCAVNDAK